jgi:hypothetical protein
MLTEVCGVLGWLQVQRLCSAMVSSKPPAGKEFDLQQEQVFFVKVRPGCDGMLYSCRQLEASRS